MIYRMRKIVSHLDDMPLPTCMYRLKNINNFDDETINDANEPDLKIKEQVIKFLKIPCKKMAELEKRQDHLLLQLDVLYERIKSLSTLCKNQPLASTLATRQATAPQIAVPSEVIINASADHLPYFLLLLAKGSLKNEITLTCHIHSSVPIASVGKIKNFIKLFKHEKLSGPINVTLIFKDVAANIEMKLSASDVPIVGEVNILRYIAYGFPDAVPYQETYQVDSLLDHCYFLQRTQHNETAFQRLFSSYRGDWILGKQFSILDLAVFSSIKQMEPIPPNIFRAVPRPWFDKVSELLK